MKSFIKLLFAIIIVALFKNQTYAIGFDNSLLHFTGSETAVAGDPATILTTNYLDVNRANFLVTNAPGATQQERDFANYHLSILKLSAELAKFGGNTAPYNTLNGGVYNLQTTPTNIANLNKYTAYRTEFTQLITLNALTLNYQTRLRSIIIRPTNSPTNARCVFVSTGTGGLLSDVGSNFIVSVADLLMRGYVVVFYENLSGGRVISSTNIFVPNPQTLGYLGAASLYPTLASPNVYNLGQHIQFLVANAIKDVVLSPTITNLLSIDVNNLFTTGFSAGCVYSNALLLSSANNFQPNLDGYGGCNYNPKVTFTPAGFQSTANINFRGGINLGGTLQKVNIPGMINTLDITDINKRMYFVFGVDDIQTHIFTGTDANIEGYKVTKDRLDLLGLRNYINGTCNATHQMYLQSDNNDGYFNSLEMKNLIAAISSTTNINNIYSSITGNPTFNATLNNFKKMNTQVFQVRNNVSQFISNTIGNTTQIIGTSNFTNNFELIKCTGNLSSTIPFTSESPDWIFTNNLYTCSNLLKTNYGSTNRINKINLNESKNQFQSLYPNPSQGKINLNIKLDETASDFVLSIYAVNGSQIYTKAITETVEKENYLTKEIDIANEPNGIYFLRVTANNKVLYTNTFVLKK